MSLLEKKCDLCDVVMSTGSCPHLLDLEDGRVALRRSVWERTVSQSIIKAEPHMGLVHTRDIISELEARIEISRCTVPSDAPDSANLPLALLRSLRHVLTTEELDYRTVDS